MKNTKVIWTIGILLFIVLCNIIPALNNIAILLGEGKFINNGNERFITKDKLLVSMSSDKLNDKKNNGINDDYYYLEYRKTYPLRDSVLCRTDKIYFYQFWRWQEYLFAPQWKQPYLSISINEWNKIQNEMWANDRKYGTPFPRDSTIQTKK